MRRLVAVAVSIALVVSFSVLVSAAGGGGYSITEEPELTVNRTVTYGWDVKGDFTPSDTLEVDSGEEGDAILLVDVTRWVDEDVLDFDLDLDAVAEEGASPATLGDMTAVLETTTEPDPEEDDWDELVTVFDENLPGSIEGAEDDDVAVAIDQDFSLDLVNDLDEGEREDFGAADAYRLRIKVKIGTHFYTQYVLFTLPDEEDVTYNNADAVVQTDLGYALSDADLTADLAGTKWDIDDEDLSETWDVDEEDLVEDEDTGEFADSASLYAQDIAGDDGSYDVDVDIALWGDDTEEALASTTASLEVVFGEVDEEEASEKGDQERDRDAWVDGLHPVHGMWMPPVHPGDDITLGNGALPLKFWLPDDADADEVSLVLFDAEEVDPEDLNSEDPVYEWELTTNEGSMYKLILHLKKLNESLDPGTYYVAVKTGDEILNGEDQVLTITVPDFEAEGHGNHGDHGNPHGHGKDK